MFESQIDTVMQIRHLCLTLAAAPPSILCVNFQVISLYPRITYYPAFVDPVRCNQIIEQAKTQLGPSGLAYKPGDKIEEKQVAGSHVHQSGLYTNPSTA